MAFFNDSPTKVCATVTCSRLAGTAGSGVLPAATVVTRRVKIPRTAMAFPSLVTIFSILELDISSRIRLCAASRGRIMKDRDGIKLEEPDWHRCGERLIDFDVKGQLETYQGSGLIPTSFQPVEKWSRTIGCG
jgi:hypothetical protein